MIGIKYKGEFLDLAPGQDGELTRNSPLFGFDQVLAEYSTPITLSGTGKNARLIGFLFFDLTAKAKTKIEVEVFSNTTYRFRASLLIEGAGMNRLYAHQGSATGYLLTGISDFFALIKDKKLTELRLGGTLSIPFTTWEPTDGSNGFWQQFNASLDFTADYVCQPCRNDTWNGSDDVDSPDWMNVLGNDGYLSPLSPVAPFLKIEYLLRQIFAEQGWTLDTTGLNDEEWKKLILFTAAIIKTCDVSYVFNTGVNEYIPTFTPINPLVFSYASLLPADKTVAEFILSLCNRYAWAPICDAEARVCRLIALKENGSFAVKDWTGYSSDSSSTDFSKDARIFQFKNTFEGEDELPSAPSFDGLTIDPARQNKSELPDPTFGYYDDRVIFVFKENQWFKIELNNDTNLREWVIFADNIYDDEVSGATDTIETKCTTLPTYFTKYRTAAGVDYYGYFPACRQSRFQKWGIRTLLYHGRVREQKLDGTPGTVSYPFASANSLAPNTLDDLPWSNVFDHSYKTKVKGLVPYWWESWLNRISNPEEIKRRYYLPLHVWINFRWDDIILDSNIAYLIKSTVEHVAYKGYVECTLQRLHWDTPADTTNTSGIYLQMVWENVVHSDTFGTYLVYHNCDHGDVVIYAWHDPAGTIPYTPNNLPVTYKSYLRIGDTSQPFDAASSFNIVVNAQRTVIYTDIFKEGDLIYTTTDHWTADYRLEPDAGYNII